MFIPGFVRPLQRDRCSGSSTVENFLWINVMNEAEVILRDQCVIGRASVSLPCRNDNVALVQS
jgi:hypothetical protein